MVGTMNSIIMISNDPRVAVVRETFQQLLVARITLLSDFDTGLKEVFEKRPLVVFIQDEIAGVRGETVTRHIRSLLQTNSPHFIQLNHASAAPGMVRGFGNGISLNLPAEELCEQFREELEQFPDILWKKDLAQPPEQSPDIRWKKDFALPLEPEPALSAAEVSPSDAALSSPPLCAPAALPPVDFVTFPLDEKAASAHPPAAAAAPRPELPASQATTVAESTPLPHPEGMQESVGITEGYAWPPPFPVEPATPARRWRFPFLVGGGGFLFVCGSALFLFIPLGPQPRERTGPPRQPIPVSAPLKQAPVAALLPRRIPSFIPQEGFDSTYGEAKPGWERYVSPRREYLLFREKGVFRALQVIARQQEAIDPPFVASLFKELCGDPPVIRSKSSRDGYLIEQGESSTGAEVILYKKKGTGETRGVVITLP